ncbi:MAG TPA: PAS domain S-box protein, partial [Spirochaetota bacterium]|nr:PAS domain S-box protein [Spirochaetota bacterium]
MNIYFFLFFLSFVIYSYFALYSIYLNKKSPLNILFSLYSLSLAFWALGYTFMYSESNMDRIWFWYKLSGIGWCFMQALGLHFALILSKKDKILKNNIFKVVLYIPPTFFYLNVLFSKLFAGEFILNNGDLTEIFTAPSIKTIFYFTYHTVYLSLFIYFIWKWGKDSTKKSEKIQSKILIIVAFIPFILGTFTDGVLPMLKIYTIKPVGILTILVWISGIWYVIIKYKFLKIKSFYPAFNEILSKMTDILVIINHNGSILKVNKKFQDLLSYKESELISDDINKYINYDDKNWYKKVTKENHLSFYCELISQNDNKIPVNLYSSILKDEDDEDAGILIIGQDIRLTLQLQNEIGEREAAEKILKQSEERYKTLVSKIPEMILIHKDDIVVYLNKSSEVFTGYKPEEVVGTSIFNYIYDEYKPLSMQNMKRRLAGEDIPDHEIVLIDKYGNKKTAIVRSSVTFYDNQPMFLTLLIDITERKKIEEDIRKAKEIAEIANKTKSEFLA